MVILQLNPDVKHTYARVIWRGAPDKLATNKLHFLCADRKVGVTRSSMQFHYVLAMSIAKVLPIGDTNVFFVHVQSSICLHELSQSGESH